MVDKQWLSEEQFNILLNHPLINEEVVNSLTESVIVQGALPVGLLPSIIMDDKAYVIPTTVKEPLVVAVASYDVELVSQADGFRTVSSERIMIGQIVSDDVDDTEKLSAGIKALEKQIHQIADEAYPSTKARGGGYQRIAIGTFPGQQLLFLKVFVSTKDTMGVNTLNTILEAITALLKNEFPWGDILMSVLSNHATVSVVKVQDETDIKGLARDGRTGEEIAKRIERASVSVQIDTHHITARNKGIMSGIHAAVLVTGNDTRGVEASTHVYAGKDGQYRGIAAWRYDQRRQRLVGTMEVPMALAITGGGAKVLPVAKALLELLNVESA